VTASGTTCPQCGSPIAPQQDWCLACGTGARTRMVPTPNWRLPIATILAIVLLAGSALVVAFLALTGDTSTTTTVTTPAPAAAPVTTTTPAATTGGVTATNTTPAPSGTATATTSTAPVAPPTTG
jgi:hypothetical protein